jgi:hypothetical protein
MLRSAGGRAAGASVAALSDIAETLPSFVYQLTPNRNAKASAADNRPSTHQPALGTDLGVAVHHGSRASTAPLLRGTVWIQW